MPNNLRLDTEQPESQQAAPTLLPQHVYRGKRFAKVLLLDGYSTRTLACVRSWGKHHVPFAVGGETRWDMSLLSRYSKQTFVYTSPKRNLSGFVQDVNRYCREFAADSVFPTSEAAIMACSKYRNELSCVPIIPSERAIETTFCKANTLKLAKSLGISVPTTVHVSRASWDEIGALQLKFPVAVKSASSEVIHSGKAETSHKTAYAFNRGELERECASRLEKGQTVLVQEYIDGYGVGVSGLFAEGHPVVVLGHRRIRESNPLGGPSAVAETIPVEPRLLEAATSLLRTVGFSGPAMVEYKIDRRCGQPYLMEINGRFWGTVMLASAAGLDLPYLYWKMLNGIEVKPGEKRYKIGIKGRYLVGDTKWLLVCLRGKPALCPGEFPTRWASVRSYVGSFFDPRTTELIFAREDPMPFFGRVMQELI